MADSLIEVVYVAHPHPHGPNDAMTARQSLAPLLVDTGGDVARTDLGEVGEHRTLGGFYQVPRGEKVILEEFIQDSRKIERGRS